MCCNAVRRFNEVITQQNYAPCRFQTLAAVVPDMLLKQLFVLKVLCDNAFHRLSIRRHVTARFRFFKRRFCNLIKTLDEWVHYPFVNFFELKLLVKFFCVC